MSGHARETRHRQPSPTLPLGYADDVPIEHDPLNPHREHPTPLELVVRLTRSERETRVKRLIEMAWDRYEEASEKLSGDRATAAVCALVSGGNDSYTVAHLFRSVTTHHVHANTGTGIEATREFVRATAAAWKVQLIERGPAAGSTYWDMVLGNLTARSRDTGELVQAWPGGFPGPAAHRICYQRLKERALEQIPHHFGISGSRTDQVVFIAGRRRPESKVRATVPHYQRKGTVLWKSPIAVWHKADLRTYRLMHPDVPINPVAQRLGMSGECGCLANATADEPQRWREAYPHDPFIRKVAEHEALIADRPDIPEHRKKWGWGGAYDDPDEVESLADALCTVNCGPDPLFDLMDPLFTEAGQ